LGDPLYTPGMPTAVMLGRAALAALLTGAAAARALDDPRIDEKTGRDQANYPLDRHFDHLHMRLEIDIPDMGQP
jgi:hypothetical protein